MRCVPLIGIRGSINYTPLTVLRQWGHQQIVPAGARLKDQEVLYTAANYQVEASRFLSHWNRSHTYVPVMDEDTSKADEGYEQWRTLRRVKTPENQMNTERSESSHPHHSNEITVWKIKELEDQLSKAQRTIAEFLHDRVALEQLKDKVALQGSNLVEREKAYQILQEECHRLKQEQITNKRKADYLLAQKDDVLDHQIREVDRLKSQVREQRSRINQLEDEVFLSIQQYQTVQDDAETLIQDNHWLKTRVQELEKQNTGQKQVVQTIIDRSLPVYDAVNGIARGVRELERYLLPHQPEPIGLAGLKEKYKTLVKAIFHKDEHRT